MNNNVLYRKYRSRSFNEVLAQDHVVSVLKESIYSQRSAHAYLFAGPRGTGKTTLARLLAKAVNCKNFNKNKDVCNECEFCISINDGNNIDIIEMDAASNRGIEEIRTLKDNVNYLPTTLSKKVYIIDEAHMLTKEAFNALLKTLEEPPSHVLFVLATTEPHKIPITIISRVERYDLRLATLKELSDKLSLILQQEGVESDKNSLELLYKKSGGSFRDAESILSKILSSLEGKTITIESVNKILGLVEEESISKLLNLLFKKDALGSIQFLGELISSGVNIATLVDESLELIRFRMSSKEQNYIMELLNLANLFISIKKQFKDFNDKQLIAEIEIMRYCSQGKQITRNEIASPDLVESNKVTNSEVEKIQVLEKINDNNLLISKLVEVLKGKSMRIGAILESSRLEVKGSKLIISNRSKFNTSFLGKKDINEAILEVLTKLSDSISQIEILLVEESIKEDIKPEEVHVDAVSDPVVMVKNNKVKKEQIDNSDIVENIL